MGKGDKPRWPQIPVKELHENYDDLYCVQCHNKFKVSGSEYCSDCITTNAPLPDDMNAEGKLRARVDEAFNSEGKIRAKVAQADKDRLTREAVRKAEARIYDNAIRNTPPDPKKNCGLCGHWNEISRICSVDQKEYHFSSGCDKWIEFYGTADLARK